MTSDAVDGFAVFYNKIIYKSVGCLFYPNTTIALIYQSTINLIPFG